MSTTVMVSGGFDPLHVGHIQYIKNSALLGDRLIVALNSDEWLHRKKGYVFMPWEERAMILSQLRFVDNVVSFDDSDDTAIDAIRNYLEAGDIFANAGDRGPKNTPELDYCDAHEIIPEFDVVDTNGESSQNYVHNVIDQIYDAQERPWGNFYILDRGPNYWVKRLTINPGECTSLQAHKMRSEKWTVLEGVIRVDFGYQDSTDAPYREVVPEGDTFNVPERMPHRITCFGDSPAVVLEVAEGVCREDDIERFSDAYGRV